VEIIITIIIIIVIIIFIFIIIIIIITPKHQHANNCLPSPIYHSFLHTMQEQRGRGAEERTQEGDGKEEDSNHTHNEQQGWG